MNNYRMETTEELKRAQLMIRQILIDQAKNGKPISYSDLVIRVQKYQFDPDSSVFHGLLGNISMEENDLGRGLLSVVVVRKDDMISGEAFFTMAGYVGRNISDKIKMWIEEFNFVCNYWKQQV